VVTITLLDLDTVLSVIGFPSKAVATKFAQSMLIDGKMNTKGMVWHFGSPAVS
jgi:hypothetical protein